MNHHFTLPNSGHNYDAKASKMGMWLFLYTELILFGGLFLVYMVYRSLNQDAFLLASFNLNVWMGTANTIVLLTSSMTVAMAISALQKGDSKKSIFLLWMTILAALFFLVVKYFEWSAKFEHGLFPGMDHFNQLPNGEKLYFNLYFFMTGLHGLHVIVGGIFIVIVVFKIKSGKVNKDRYQLLENSGLYWHLVDLIWIYLFPLFYLIH
ncbi:MAG: cytochrome C oxidase subunit III [Bacteroidetes bacterium GWF2_41_31]|nr:MAG: cytochrome C oxidase subunit III [Bacteroidetes bacterium GWF2_41_31]OFZ09419.1 MAG: cytochrome C oxidase subunit III [Bacteroidetes bacterium RIFOXYB12_FULL_41_6]